MSTAQIRTLKYSLVKIYRVMREVMSQTTLANNSIDDTTRPWYPSPMLSAFPVLLLFSPAEVGGRVAGRKGGCRCLEQGWLSRSTSLFPYVAKSAYR